MGYLIPGGRIKRFGDSLLTEATANQLVQHIPMIKASRGNSLTKGSDTIARAKTAAADISRTAPTFNDPRYTFTTLSIPTDQRTLNGLYRFFDDTDPATGNAIRLHTEFPLSRLGLTECGDSVIQRHYEDMWDRINLQKLMFDIGIEYWRLGNCFPFGAWNDDDYMWEQFVILNPDYVTVESTYLNEKPYIKLQPDEHLKRIVSSGQPRDLYEQLPPQIIKYVRLGQEIPLSPNNVFHLAHNKAPYENLGRSIIKRILKILIYEDRMSMANFAIATRQVIPITVVKLGDPQSGWVPEQDEIDDIREMMASREVDPNFTIFYHWGIDIQFYGASGKIMNLAPEFARTLKWKLMGLGISESILSGGSNYASAYAQLEVLRQRYLHFQLMLERFVHRGLFEPVARLCGFYKTNKLQAGYGRCDYKHGDCDPDASKHMNSNSIIKNAEYQEYLKKRAANINTQKSLKYVYPHMDWDLMSLNNDVQYKNFLMNLEKLFPSARKVSESTLFRAANLDPDIERKKIKEEHEKNLSDAYENAKINKEYIRKFTEEGLPLPPELAPPTPGIGAPGGVLGGGAAMPPAIPGTPSPAGGGVGAGGQVTTPNAPIGKPNMTGAGTPGTPSTPAGPASARQESVQIQKGMTQSSKVLDDVLTKESSEIIAANDLEAGELKKVNADLMKQRNNDREDANGT